MTYSRKELDRMFETFAYHCGVMMTEPAPHKGAMGVGGAMLRFEITPRQGTHAKLDPKTGKAKVNVWDQVAIFDDDGRRWTIGNRCAGRKAYAQAMSDTLLAAAQSVVDD